ncbi:MAG: hypothetical protein CM15mP55_1690 [Hyphomicrobiales bacterium]|nr:MAG: hypothetical protein CM15mP55_1690 [Hyphomicrobiales bacterium]
MIRLALESASAVWVGRRDAALCACYMARACGCPKRLQLDVKSLPPTKTEPCAFWEGNKERQVPFYRSFDRRLMIIYAPRLLVLRLRIRFFVVYAVAACRRARPR